jgi:hypothetical protein
MSTFFPVAVYLLVQAAMNSQNLFQVVSHGILFLSVYSYFAGHNVLGLNSFNRSMPGRVMPGICQLWPT